VTGMMLFCATGNLLLLFLGLELLSCPVRLTQPCACGPAMEGA